VWSTLPPYAPVIWCVPVPIANAAYLTVHPDCDELTGTRLHVMGANPPGPLEMKPTIPAGGDGLPDVSAAAKVQLVELAFTYT
jgi:hypothetical protein